jgi:uncharacterized protein YkwD
LERAEALLARAKPGEAVRALAEQIATMRSARAELELKIAEALKLGSTDPHAAREKLRELGDAQSDPVARQRVQRGISDLAAALLAGQPSAQGAPGDAGKSGTPSAAVAGTLQELRKKVDAALAKSDLEQAGEHLASAIERAPEGLERTGLECQAKQLDARRELRRELVEQLGPNRRRDTAEMVADVPPPFLGARSAADVDWSAVLLEDFLIGAGLAELGPKARLGLLFERLELAWGAQLDEALVDLGYARNAGDVSLPQASWLIARLRAEPFDPAGYSFENGVWTSTQAATPGFAPTREWSRANFLNAGPKDREKALQILRVTGDIDFLRLTVMARWQRAQRELAASRVLPQLEKLALERKLLDEARGAALALIFDQKAYFFPFDPPPKGLTKAQYLQVQRKIDGHLDKVLRAWSSTRRVRLTKSFRAAAEDLAWMQSKKAEYFLELPLTVPTYVLAVDETREELGLPEFALTRDELLAVRRDEAVLAHSVALQKRDRRENPAQAADDKEFELATAVNDYRRMLGRQVLAWNPPLHRAAKGHAQFLMDKGALTHLQDSPSLRTPSDRMAAAGYAEGEVENLASNVYEPLEAFKRWCQSSQEHRNLLESVYTEMGVGRAGLYWVQTLGAGTKFLENLER